MQVGKHSIKLVLFEPEIPPNTGNVARLCAGTATSLHLIEPLGFSIDDKHLKRAGLDYWPNVDVTVHPDWNHFLETVQPKRLVTTSARTGTPAHIFPFEDGDCIVLGPETRGLPETIFEQCEHRVRIPILDTIRSLNMSTAAGILLYAALTATNSFEE